MVFVNDTDQQAQDADPGDKADDEACVEILLLLLLLEHLHSLLEVVSACLWLLMLHWQTLWIGNP